MRTVAGGLVVGPAHRTEAALERFSEAQGIIAPVDASGPPVLRGPRHRVAGCVGQTSNGGNFVAEVAKVLVGKVALRPTHKPAQAAKVCPEHLPVRAIVVKAAIFINDREKRNGRTCLARALSVGVGACKVT